MISNGLLYLHMFLHQTHYDRKDPILRRTSERYGMPEATRISYKMNLNYGCFLAFKMPSQVAKAAFQRNNNPLDAAIFYLAMKKKAVIWGLYRYSSHYMEFHTV